MRRGKKSQLAGMTLIEVLLASLLLALATYSTVRGIRTSDHMLYAGLVNGKVASMIRARSAELESWSFERFRRTVLFGNAGGPFTAASGNAYEFKRGSLGGNATEGFPFLVTGVGAFDPFVEVSSSPIAESFGGAHYLMEVSPVPGDAQAKAFEYSEFVRLEFSDVASSAGKVRVVYELVYRDDFSEVDPKPQKTARVVMIKSDGGRDVTE